ncbi:MAG TPA: hypothetical protein VJ841_03450 [Candidatus Saccharimonadales bacterium]|nr:hypothetical protein [Candidatus Saccharimonadales bacterium]
MDWNMFDEVERLLDEIDGELKAQRLISMLFIIANAGLSIWTAVNHAVLLTIINFLLLVAWSIVFIQHTDDLEHNDAHRRDMKHLRKIVEDAEREKSK